MKSALHIVVAILILMVLPQSSRATHIVGGELNYTCLGGETYEITLTIFRDCENAEADFDPFASVGIFNNNILVTNIGFGGQVLIPLMEIDTLEPVLFNECLVIPPEVCVDTTNYRAILDLPFVQGGYTLAYQRCCRNMTIQNIINPLATGATYSVEISETALLECNSNAKFNNWPPTFICVNEPIEFDHSATDINGDSLVYKLCTPFQGANQMIPQPQPPNNPPFQEIEWFTPTYGLNNMLGGVPLSIDSETGFLTGTPNTVGQFVVGICVEEYRDGELISTTRRDFQYNVGICGQPISSFFVPEVNCDGLTIEFDNLSTNSTEFIWEFNDPGNPGASSNEPTPTYTFSDTGTYTVTLIAEPNNVCVDTFELTVTMLFPSLFADFDLNLVSCNNPFGLDLIDLSFDTISTIVDWEWTVDGNFYSDLQTPPTYTDPLANTATVGLTVTAENECMEFFEQTISVGIQVDVPDNINNCQLSDSLTIQTENLIPGDVLTYQWEPSAGIIANGNTGMPLVDVTISDMYYVTITNQDNCEWIDSVFIDNSGTPPALGITAEPVTIYNGESTLLTATQNNNYEYTWTPTNSLNNSSIYNPVATPDETTEYSLSITDEFGCTNSALITIVVLNAVCEEPFIFIPNAFTPNGDGENDIIKVEGRLIDEMYLAIYDRWGELVFETTDPSQGWDGNFNGELSEPDVYGFYLRLRCFNGEEYFKKGNITLLR